MEKTRLDPEEIITYVIVEVRLGEIALNDVLKEIDRIAYGYDEPAIIEFKKEAYARLLRINELGFSGLLDTYTKWYAQPETDEVRRIMVAITFEEMYERMVK